MVDSNLIEQKFFSLCLLLFFFNKRIFDQLKISCFGLNKAPSSKVEPAQFLFICNVFFMLILPPPLLVNASYNFFFFPSLRFKYVLLNVLHTRTHTRATRRQSLFRLADEDLTPTRWTQMVRTNGVNWQQFFDDERSRQHPVVATPPTPIGRSVDRWVGLFASQYHDGP